MVVYQTRALDWNIVGHEHAVDILRRTLAAEQVRHAYLFVGPQHIGKTLFAHRFAQTLLCTGGTIRVWLPLVHVTHVYHVVRCYMVTIPMCMLLPNLLINRQSS